MFTGIDIDDIENLEDLLRVVLIKSESSGGELTRNTNEKKKSDVLQAYKSPLCDKCCRRGSSISQWNIVNQLGKPDFPCG